MSEKQPVTDHQERKRKKRRHRVRRWIALFIVLAVVGGAGFLVVRKLQRDYTVTYDAYTTTTGNISNSLSYSGSMQLINNKTYTAEASAKVREVCVKTGDMVKKGDRLMRLSDGTILKAEFDGTVNKIDVEAGDEVEKEATLVQVADFSRMLISFRVGESDISQVSVGQEIRVTVASAEAIFRSTVKSIDYASYSGNNVAYYTATAEVDTSSTNNIYPGMQATVSITKEAADNVVILKMDAISTARDNSAYVYLQGEDGKMTEQPITVGVSNGNYAEIREGLAAGQTVYVAVKTEEQNTGLLSGLFGTQQVNMPAGGMRNFGNGNGGSNRPSGGSGSRGGN